MSNSLHILLAISYNSCIYYFACNIQILFCLFMLFYVQSMCVGASAVHMMVIHEISHIICHCVMIVLYLVEVNVFSFLLCYIEIHSLIHYCYSILYIYALYGITYTGIYIQFYIFYVTYLHYQSDHIYILKAKRLPYHFSFLQA